MPKITFDSDEEFTFDEDLTPTKTTQTTHDTSDEDSDDDAMPEAVSIRSSRDQATSEAKAQKEAALIMAKADKEKRRQRDLQLKQQKQGSRRDLKKQQKQQEQPSAKSDSDSESDDEDDEQVEEGKSQRLPQDILDTWVESTPVGSKRTHMTMADFEEVQAAYEAQVEQQLAEQRKKQKKADRGRKVGEYTVKVLNQRPKVAKTGKNLRDMVNSKLHRKANERENAVLQRSAGRFGSSALVFRRSEPVKQTKK
ncbi:hypothetical protein BCR42DRAFT_490508 [Absidia repens]|uniref:Uncharacterized protein n=1 Tax=Absidia repens TaxID=90262 RepID=A0A1X2IJS0_9FUNG|nr:hypothetical protein BCR42DRAFT_490508 [Absidia repens]